MMCEYCDLANFKKLGDEWSEGPSVDDHDNHASLDCDHGEWSLCIENVDRAYAEVCITWVKVNFCPWCGRDLKG